MRELMCLVDGVVGPVDIPLDSIPIHPCRSSSTPRMHQRSGHPTQGSTISHSPLEHKLLTPRPRKRRKLRGAQHPYERAFSDDQFPHSLLHYLTGEETPLNPQVFVVTATRAPGDRISSHRILRRFESIKAASLGLGTSPEEP